MGIEWLQEMNTASMDEIEKKNQEETERQNTLEYQCTQETVTGYICRFLREYGKKNSLDIHFDSDGIVRKFKVGNVTVTMAVGFWLDGSLKITVNQKELENNQWWQEALDQVGLSEKAIDKIKN